MCRWSGRRGVGRSLDLQALVGGFRESQASRTRTAPGGGGELLLELGAGPESLIQAWAKGPEGMVLIG